MATLTLQGGQQHRLLLASLETTIRDSGYRLHTFTLQERDFQGSIIHPILVYFKLETREG